MMHEAMKPTTKKRILLVANTARFFVLFEQNDIHILQEMGYEVHCASNFEGEKDVDAKAILSKAEVVLHQLDIARSPISTGNVKAYRQLQALTQQIRFDAVHCHTPMGSVLARLAAKSIGISPIIYTVHGLHFYKGCPIQNRVLYEPVERCLARCTDALITINEEDYRTAQTFHLRGKAYKVPGVGIDVKAISGISVEREEKRKEIGVPINAAVIISVGDLIKRKNHIVALRAFAKANIPDSYYVLCGNGEEKQTLQSEAQLLGVERRVLFLGYRNDVRELLRAADVFCFPSLQEGLPVALMEAMASGLPCVASRIRGNTDLLGENYKYLFAPNEPDKLAALLPQLLENKDAIGDECFGKIKAFDISEVQQEMRKIYADTLNKNGGGVQRLILTQALRKELKISLNATVFVSVGDLNSNKNHASAIKAFAKANVPNSYYLICGSGKLGNNLRTLASNLGVSNRVLLLGFREDVRVILQMADVFVFPSKREGLSVALMEAMASGLPCVASKIRGNTDLLGEAYRYYFDVNKPMELVAAITSICQNRAAVGYYCYERSKLFDTAIVAETMNAIYSKILK